LSIFLETRRHALLYDTGARFSPRFDAGSAVIVPYLRHRGIDALDMLVLSHGDSDHVGGMAAVVGEVEVRDRISSVPEKVPSARPCLAGDGWEWDGVRFAILSPADLGVPDHNNASCVIKITGDSGSALLTGDIEKEVEAELASSFPEALGSEVLLVPHQGSKTSSTAHFIDLVSAEIAVVSTGYRNRYGHPDATVVRRYRMRNTPLFNTALDGAITVRVAGGRIAVESYRDTGRRYWFARAGG
jgi:competence protein ComEC